jgi:hypothetical protein
MEKEEKPRTLKQNRAIHKYFIDVANECVAQGLSLKQVLNEFEIEIDEVIIKKLAQHIGMVKYSKAHTSDMTTTELSNVIDTLLVALSKMGLETDFPSADLKSILEYYEREANRHN